jgi:hypothetical protein
VLFHIHSSATFNSFMAIFHIHIYIYIYTYRYIYIYIYISYTSAYTAVRRLPNPQLQNIRSWASSSPNPLFFIASAMSILITCLNHLSFLASVLSYSISYLHNLRLEISGKGKLLKNMHPL